MLKEISDQQLDSVMGGWEATNPETGASYVSAPGLGVAKSTTITPGSFNVSLGNDSGSVICCPPQVNVNVVSLSWSLPVTKTEYISQWQAGNELYRAGERRP